MNEEDLRKRALSLIQNAESAVFITILKEIAEAIRPIAPDVPDVNKRFVSLRNKYVHILLENIEHQDPAHAAALQDVIDTYCTNLPFDYETDDDETDSGTGTK